MHVVGVLLQLELLLIRRALGIRFVGWIAGPHVGNLLRIVAPSEGRQGGQGGHRDAAAGRNHGHDRHSGEGDNHDGYAVRAHGMRS